MGRIIDGPIMEPERARMPRFLAGGRGEEKSLRAM
jgi:hypothetical protein